MLFDQAQAQAIRGNYTSLYVVIGGLIPLCCFFNSYSLGIFWFAGPGAKPGIYFKVDWNIK